jgi:hypothetical protein
MPKKNVEYKSIKCKLKSVLKHDEWLPLIKKRVDIVNRIWLEAYNLFNLYILNKLNSNKILNFNYNTIERCVLFVIGKSTSIKGRNIDIKLINKKIKNLEKILIKEKNNEKMIEINKDIRKLQREIERYLEYKDLEIFYVNQFENLENIQLEKYDIDSIKKPFANYIINIIYDISRQIMVNIKNHTSIHFNKFQKRYLKAQIMNYYCVFDTFSKLHIKKSHMYSILNCIKYHINNKVDTMTIKSKELNKLKNIEELKPIMQKIIDDEKKNILGERVANKSLILIRKSILMKIYKIFTDLKKYSRIRFHLICKIIILAYLNIIIL